MEEIEKLIDELQNENFNFQESEFYDEKIYASTLLRKALIYYNKIGYAKNKEEYQRLKNKLDCIMSSKIRNLNPDFDDNIIKEMVDCLKRGIFQYPIDMFVVSQGVFLKEGTYDDFGSLYKMKTFMFRMNGKYYDVYDGSDFLIENPFSLLDRVRLTNEQNMALSKFISDNINNLLSPSNETRIVKPIYELNKYGVFYGASGITYGDVRGINIYLSKKFPDIALSMMNKEECDIEMLVQKGDDIEVYLFHQLFKEENPVWYGKRVDAPIWRLSEEAMKQERGLLRNK